MAEIDPKKVLERAKRRVGTRILDGNSEKAIEGISEKYGLTKNQVRDIVTAPFRHLKAVRKAYPNENAGFPNMRVPVLGSFVCRDKVRDIHIKYVNDVHNRREE